MILVNLTPHDVIVFGWNDETLIPASGTVVRVSHTTTRVGEVNGIPVTKTVFGQVEGLPDETDGICYIVSQLVASACPERKDLYFPSGAVRDTDGHIVGCKSLSQMCE